MPRSESPSIEIMPSTGPDLRKSPGPSSVPHLSRLRTSSPLPLDAPPVLDHLSLVTPPYPSQKQAHNQHHSCRTLKTPGDDGVLSAGKQDEGFDAAFGGMVSTDSGEGSEKESPNLGGSSADMEDLPSAPGAPLSPMSHVFARMDQSLFRAQSQTPPPASSPPPLCDPFIDPLLYMENMGKPTSTAGILLASAPGFVFQRTPPRREPLIITTQEKNDLDNPFATLASDPRVFGQAPINSLTFGRTVNHSNTTPPRTPSSSAPASTLIPTPLSSTPPSSTTQNSDTSTTVNYTIHGAVINANLSVSDNTTQERRQIRPHPIKKPQTSSVNATLLSSGGDAHPSGGNTTSAPGGATPAPLSADANTAPSSTFAISAITTPPSIGTVACSPSSCTNPTPPSSGASAIIVPHSAVAISPASSIDATTSDNTIPAPPSGDGQSDKENHAPSTELTHYQKAALTRARKKSKATGAPGALGKGTNGTGDNEKGSKASGGRAKKRKEPEGGKEPEGSRKSRSGREVRKPNYWVPDA
jgi:hypothetical protein